MHTLKIKPRCGQRAKSGHPWIFSNEVNHQKPFPISGEIVRVDDDTGKFIGYAIYNPHSLISLRLLSREIEDIPGREEWFEKRIERALMLRQRVYPNRRSYRLIYADSDERKFKKFKAKYFSMCNLCIAKLPQKWHNT